MRPPQKNKPEATEAQIKIMTLACEATAQITASMVSVTNEKNPAKINEAFKSIYKGIHEVISKPM